MEANYSENILSYIAKSEDINNSANGSEGSCPNSSSTEPNNLDFLNNHEYNDENNHKTKTFQYILYPTIAP